MSAYVAEALERQIAAIRSCERSCERFGGNARSRRTGGTLLRKASPFYWSGRCTEVVVAALNSFRPADICVSRDLLYCDFAWCWFEVPWISIPCGRQTVPVRAVSWIWYDRPHIKGGVSRQTLGIAAWILNDYNPAPSPLVWDCLVDGARLDSPPDEGYWDGSLIGLSGTTVPVETQRLRGFVVAASTFLRQRLFAVESRRAERHARKRLTAAGWDGDANVSVVLLRARDSGREATAGEPVDVEWSHRWIVRGHVRQQYYPSLGTNLPLWIHPHVKGPDDKPLKPRTTPVFAVTR